ncbi:unnamed protein product [Pleuronectes platessa]|uniref:Uncharacterized protein n=1 Tax=Pleuronectes platessa TaxID=8262 RepID=A0A9N7VQ76_PLEPL|nr:unnamed protein product [Pleuronectes platessa]
MKASEEEGLLGGPLCKKLNASYNFLLPAARGPGLGVLPTRHALPLIVPCTTPAWGPPYKEKDGSTSRSPSIMSKIPAHHFGLTGTSVDCAEPAERHQGEGQAIKADKSASNCSGTTWGENEPL